MPTKKKSDRPATPASTKKRKAVIAAPVTEEAEPVFVDADDLLGRLAVELVRSRIRHRALLKTLREGDFSWEYYTKNVEEIESVDFQALFDLLVMSFESFRERHDKWMETDFASYGFKRRLNHPEINDEIELDDGDGPSE